MWRTSHFHVSCFVSLGQMHSNFHPDRHSSCHVHINTFSIKSREKFLPAFIIVNSDALPAVAGNKQTVKWGDGAAVHVPLLRLPSTSHRSLPSEEASLVPAFKKGILCSLHYQEFETLTCSRQKIENFLEKLLIAAITVHLFFLLSSTGLKT